jgi:hypothetical protein
MGAESCVVLGAEAKNFFFDTKTLSVLFSPIWLYG